MVVEQTFTACSAVTGDIFMPGAPILTSFQEGWSNVQISHYRQQLVDVLDLSYSEHVVIVPVGQGAIDLEILSEGKGSLVSYRESDFKSGCIEVRPASLPYAVRCLSEGAVMEWMQCHLEPTFLAQIAHESIDPERVRLLNTDKKIDPLLHHICLSLKYSLEQNEGSDRFYIDSMATALSAHLLCRYSTCGSSLRNYEDGLPGQILKQATDYIQAHLSRKVSLSAISQEIGVSQYYFCRLFKQSIGITPHQYLMRERIKRAKCLLKKPEQTVTSVALACGFANQSHFAKYFHKFTGMSPQEFRKW